jgi:hypothetical protein
LAVLLLLPHSYLILQFKQLCKFPLDEKPLIWA